MAGPPLAAAAPIGLLGPVFSLGGWVLDVSPFSHLPRLPDGILHAAPLIWLSAIAVALAVAGLAGVRRRDVS